MNIFIVVFVLTSTLQNVNSSSDEIDIMEYRLIDSLPKTLPKLQSLKSQDKRTTHHKGFIYLKRQPSSSKSKKRSKLSTHTKTKKKRNGITGDQSMASGMVAKKSSGLLWNEFYPWLDVPSKKAARRKHIASLLKLNFSNYDIPADRRHLDVKNSTVDAKKPKQVFFFRPKEKKNITTPVNTTIDVKSNITSLNSTSENKNSSQGNDTSFQKIISEISLENPKPVVLKLNHTKTHNKSETIKNQNKTKQEEEAVLFQKIAQMPLHLSSNTARYHPHLLMYVPPPLPFTTIQEHRLFPNIYPSVHGNMTIGSRKYIDLRKTPLETQDISSYRNVTAGRPIFSSINEAYENENQKVSKIDPVSGIPESASNVYPNDSVADSQLLQPSSSTDQISKSIVVNITNVNGTSSTATAKFSNGTKITGKLQNSIKKLKKDGKEAKANLIKDLKMSESAPFYPSKNKTGSQNLCSILLGKGVDAKILIENNCASFIKPDKGSNKKDVSKKYSAKDNNTKLINGKSSKEQESIQSYSPFGESKEGIVDGEAPKPSPFIEGKNEKDVTSENSPSIEAKQGEDKTSKNSPSIEAKKGEDEISKISPSIEAKQGEDKTSKNSPSIEAKKGEDEISKNSPSIEAKKGEDEISKNSPSIEAKQGEDKTSKNSPSIEAKKGEDEISKISPSIEAKQGEDKTSKNSPSIEAKKGEDEISKISLSIEAKKEKDERTKPSTPIEGKKDDDGKQEQKNDSLKVKESKSALDHVIYLDTEPSPPDSAISTTSPSSLSDSKNVAFSALPETNTSNTVPSFGNSTVGTASFLESDVEVGSKNKFPKTIPTFSNISKSELAGEMDTEIAKVEVDSKSGEVTNADASKITDKSSDKSSEKEKGLQVTDKESAKADEKSSKSESENNSDQESAKADESTKTTDQTSETISGKESAKTSDQKSSENNSEKSTDTSSLIDKYLDNEAAEAIENAKTDSAEKPTSEKVNDDAPVSQDSEDILASLSKLSAEFAAEPSNATESIIDVPLKNKAKLMKYPTFESGSFLDTDVELGANEHFIKTVPTMTNITVPFAEGTTDDDSQSKTSHSTEEKTKDRSANIEENSASVETMSRMARLMLPGSESESVHHIKMSKDVLGTTETKTSTPKMVKKKKETQQANNNTKTDSKTSNATIVDKLGAGNKSVSVEPLTKKEKKKIEKKVKDYETKSKADKKKDSGQSTVTELKGTFSIASLAHMKGSKDNNEIINKKLEQYENATLTPEQKSARTASLNVERNSTTIGDDTDMSLTKTNFVRHAAKTDKQAKDSASTND